MYTVYVLHSEQYDKIYVGYTSDLHQRIKTHNELGTKGWTIKFRPWKIVHTELFESKSQAMAREKALKSAKGRAWIWKLIAKQEGSYPPIGGREFDPPPRNNRKSASGVFYYFPGQLLLQLVWIDYLLHSFINTEA